MTKNLGLLFLRRPDPTSGPDLRSPSPTPVAAPRCPPSPTSGSNPLSPPPFIPPLSVHTPPPTPAGYNSPPTSVSSQPPTRSPTAEARSPAAAPLAPTAQSPAAAAPKRRPVPSVSSSRNSILAPESPGTWSTLGFGFRLGLQA
ncbi:classical arabinogalactan protein 9-like [Capsicum annuum]|uniref:classical arabinogalactan protein 9-like n=1 Tax=Capsicum annuum TaxID=4072 RepID=UPI001FB0604D|nr:classical arabinogalactan protein 9-like [Capsicum annuum]